MSGIVWYVCVTCGERYTERTKRGHAAFFGHKDFTLVTKP